MPGPLRIDMHVHMVGNGVGGSGGWLRLSGWHRWLAGFMVRQLGFPRDVLDGDFETVYAQHLLKLVRRFLVRRDCSAGARARARSRWHAAPRSRFDVCAE